MGFNGKLQKVLLDFLMLMVAEFALPGAKDQSSPKLEIPSEGGVNGSCIFKRFCFSSDSVFLGLLIVQMF